MFTIQKASLLDALDACMKFAGKNKVLMVMSNIRITVKDNMVRFEATTGDYTVRKYKSAIMGENCDFLVDAASLAKYAKLINSEEVKFSLEDNMVTISHQSGKLSMPTSKVENWPVSQFDNLNDAEKLTLPNVDFLLESINAAEKFVGNDDFTPQFKAIHLWCRNNSMGIDATNSRILYSNWIESEATAEFSALLSKDVLPILMQASGDRFEITVNDKCVVIGIGDTYVAQQRLQYRYPDVNRVIPKEHRVLVKTNKKELMSAIGRIAASISDYNVIKLEIGYNQLAIGSRDIDKQCLLNETVSCNSTGEMKIGFFGNQAIDCLRAIPDSEVTLCMGESGRPFVYRSESCPNLTVLQVPASL